MAKRIGRHINRKRRSEERGGAVVSFFGKSGLPEKKGCDTHPVGRMEENNEDRGEEILINSDEPMPVSSRRQIGLLKPISALVVALSILAAATLTVMSFLADGGDYASAELDEGADAEDKKVIYIRDYDDEGGILSAAELYSICSDSVVSVVARDERGRKSIGSGFVFSSDGYIATAAHVISGSNEIYTVMNNGTQYTARVITSDGNTDIALLKIDADGLSAVCFGQSRQMLVGERVYAIGTPASLDYAGTLSTGNVTYNGRVIEIYDDDGELDRRMTVIQTNADLNAGNSGCPLLDEYGRLVGMVTMKLGKGYTGIGFALPSEGVLSVLTAMKKGIAVSTDIAAGITVSAPRLGVLGESAEQDGIYGYRITGFYETTSDSQTVLKEGDLIIEINGVAVYKKSMISEEINRFAPKDKLTVTVLRYGQRLSFEVILGE